MSRLGSPDRENVHDDWMRRKAGFSIKLVFPKLMIREVTTIAAHLDIISEGEALIMVGSNVIVPEFFYIEFNSDEEKFYGCHLKERIGNAIYCLFIELIPSKHVDHLIAENSVMSVLDSIWQNKA